MAASESRSAEVVHMVQGVVHRLVQGANGLREPWCRVVQGIAHVYTRKHAPKTRRRKNHLSRIYRPCTTLHHMHHQALVRLSVVQGALTYPTPPCTKEKKEVRR